MGVTTARNPHIRAWILWEYVFDVSSSSHDVKAAPMPALYVAGHHVHIIFPIFEGLWSSLSAAQGVRVLLAGPPNV